MDDSGPSDSDNEINETQHSNLLAAVSQLDAKQRVKPPSRKEPSLQVSEFHLVKGNNNKNTVKISSLTKVLGQRGSHAEITKKLRSVRQKAKTLPRPLEKPVAAKIQRKVGFQNVKHNLGRWNAVVYSNRATDQLKFPLKQSTVEFQTTDDFVSKLKSQDRTLLEAEMDEILNSSPVIQEERKAEEEYQLTLAEMIEHRREMAKLRAQQSYMASKASRQNKIKSKKYHRLQRRERTRQQLKDFEMLQKTDPEAALKQLEQLERTRAEERVSLRHRSTGQWARNKTVRAKYDQESRQELAQQLAISRDLTQKIQTENSSDEEEEENNVTEIPSNRDNPWIAPKAINEVEEFVSGYRKYWEERTKKSEENISTDSVALSKIDIDKEDKFMNDSKKEPEKNVTLSFVNKNSEDEDSVNSEVDQADSCGVGKDRIESLRETEILENHIGINKSSDDENSDNYEEDEADFCEVDDSIESNTVNILENHVGNSLNKNSDDEANDSSGEDEADNFEVDMVGIKENRNMTEVTKNLILNSTNISSEDENDDNSGRDEEFSKITNMKFVNNNNNTNKQIFNYVNKETTAHKNKLCRKINVSRVMPPIKLKSIDKPNKKRKRKASFNVAANGYESNLTAFATTNSWTVTQIDTSERKAKELDVSKKKNLKTERSGTGKIKTIDKTELLDMFDDVEEKLKKRVQKKLNKLKLDFKIKASKTEERVSGSDDEGPSLKMRKETVRPELDEELIEQSHNDIPQQNIHSDINLNKRLAQSKIQESEVQADNIDPNKFIAMKPKHLHTELPDMITLGDEGIDDNEDDDLENKQQLTITEAFAEDDIVAEFRKEKEKAEEKSQPQNIDLTLPGWGEWAGKNLKLSTRKKRHFIIKFPTVPPRKDANKGSLIINEEKNDKVRIHQVSELPFPFASVKDFEASIRAPIGNTWVPETAHRKLIKPSVITKLGTIIQPMDEDMLVNKNKILKGMP